MPSKTAQKNNLSKNSGIILGLIGIVFGFLSFWTFYLWLYTVPLGIVLGVLSIKKSKKANKSVVWGWLAIIIALGIPFLMLLLAFVTQQF